MGSPPIALTLVHPFYPELPVTSKSGADGGGSGVWVGGERDVDADRGVVRVVAGVDDGSGAGGTVQLS